MFKNKLAMLLMAVSLLPLTAQALESDWQQEMVIQSDRAELDRKTGMVVYEGDVELTQGTLKIQSDRLVLILEGKSLKQAIAEGEPAHYEQQVSADKPVTNASAERIDYFAADKLINFSGNAELTQENNSFSGQQIRYDITAETVSASGQTPASDQSDASGESDNQRIRVIIQPQQTGQADSANNNALDTDEETAAETGE